MKKTLIFFLKFSVFAFAPGFANKNEKRLLLFERTARSSSKHIEEDRLFVDLESGLPVRRERTAQESVSYRNLVTTYRFDPSITIDRPRINLRARWDASIKAFEQGVQASEPSCRQEVFDIIERGSFLAPL